MNFYQRGKVKVVLNGKGVGYASAVGIDRDPNTGMTILKVTVEGTIKKGKEISEKENYDTFFQKFSKAFSKE